MREVAILVAVPEHFLDWMTDDTVEVTVTSGSDTWTLDVIEMEEQ